MAQPSLHPLIDSGLSKGFGGFGGGTLYCKCPTDKVAVHISGDVAHNHACGCSKCWKPDGALFSVVGVVAVDKLRVTANDNKLHVVDPSATIRRHACKECGVHMYGRIETQHPFKGLDFVHVELSNEEGWQEPQFAAFVSSIIEQGFAPDGIGGVREKFHSVGLKTYDCLSPPLMDAIASYTAEKAGTAYVVHAPAPATAAPAPRPFPAAAPAQTTAVPPKPVPAPAQKPGGIAGFFQRLFGG